VSLASVIQAEAKLLLPTYERNPLLLERGQGMYLFDVDGRRYLDFLSGIGVNALGHNHPAIRQVIVDQAERLVHISNLFFHRSQSDLAKLLTRMSGLDRAFFCNSGTEAFEGALKLARAHAQANNSNGHGPRWRFLAMEDSFHGRTFGSLAATSTKKYRQPFAPLMPGVSFVRFNDVDDLKAKFDRRVCAVCLEPVQGEGGIRPVSKKFLQTVRTLTREHGALLIADEIQCGLGRTGKYFAYQHYGVTPDIVTVAKPLAAGLPLGAILTTEAVSRCIHPGMHGTTFGGGPLACSLAIAFLEMLERENLLQHVEEVGSYFKDELLALQKRHDCIAEVRGLGLMLGVELDSPELAKSAVRAMLNAGIIINRTHETVLRFLPPYIVRKKEIDHVVHVLDRVLSEMSSKAPVSVAIRHQKEPS
jgi:acetylornithine aminotransferase/acetylornithine/N-succinyldiaminopimelate aminotransferase